jgi:hypothetical protein
MTGYVVSSGETWQCPPWAIAPSAPIDTRTSRSCGARIAWLRTTSGRLAPVNADGISHFATCPQAEDWRKRKATREEAGL